MEKEKRMLVVDIETTGFQHTGGKIVEIGIVELCLNTGERNIIFDQVTWEKGITKEEVESSWIVKNSDLTVEAIREAKEINHHRPQIQEILNDCDLGITAFNNRFDFGFMESRQFQFPKKLACPMLLATDICKIPSKFGRGYKWPNVEEAYKFFIKEDLKEKHRGADDAFHEAAIVFELYKMGIFKVN